MGRGHGSSRGSRPGGGISDRTMQGYSQTLAKAMKAREEEIRNAEWEKASIFDQKGNEIFRDDVRGNQNGIEMPDELLKNNISIHNHPHSDTFSYGDVKSTIETNSAELRVITSSGYTYSLKRPKTGWGITTDQLHNAHNDVAERIVGKTASQSMNHSYSINVLNHQVWKELSKQYGWSYTKQKRN